MSARYERVSVRDDVETHESLADVGHQPTPSSPPPSFHSRASSLRQHERERLVDPALADAFDGGDESDDEADDRQRLVRENTFLAQAESPATGSNYMPTRRPPEQPSSQATAPAVTGLGTRIYGSGIQSDGVFSNLTAKPKRDGGEKDEQPPTYEQAAADSAPPYWETTIVASGLGGPDEVFVDGMPVGSFFSFVWNGMISLSFQFVGFLLTYLLHSTHAAKNGSRAGLGITLIQYGFYLKSRSPSGGGGGHMGDGYTEPQDPNSHDFDPNTVGQEDGDSGGVWGLLDIASSEWAAYIFMIVGWFFLIKSVSDYLKARRHEQLVLQMPDRGLPVPIIAEGEAVETVV